ncbi:class I SAM-dependent methyltransferase [Rariglobus hedericola]|uniref:Class I SAM-dependent methyltransferase n=2 Tax=Rariglobus hedericola TaxID=2597822 RepID=A0A556QLK1_9BACT|nr:class I SAM-dependent methyltransferase [Rariglobus hedericola]
MDRAYWDAMAADYDGEIFSVCENDTAGLITGHITHFGSPEHTAADLGCGVGKFTPLLAQSFGRVHACDLSPKLLAQARSACRKFKNVDFLQTDLGRVAHPFDPVDFVLCVNVLIMSGLDARMAALRAVTAQVKHGGHLLLVTPSTESMLYTQFRRIDWCLREGMDCDAAIRDSVPARGSVRDLHQGIRPIAGMPTKHHLREELMVLLRNHEMDVLSVEKLTYPWTTEFDDPPAWMESPLPWDWLVVARRK